MRARKRYPISPAGWAAHDRRAARGLHDLAARLANSSSEEEIQAALSTVDADDQAELTKLIGEHARDDQAIEHGLCEEDPSEAAAARHRARAWRVVRLRLPRGGRRRIVGSQRSGSPTQPDLESNRRSGGSSPPMAFAAKAPSQVDDLGQEPEGGTPETAPRPSGEDPGPFPPPDLSAPPRASRSTSIDLIVQALVDDAIQPLREELEALRALVESRPALPRLLSIDEAARELGVGRTALYALLADPASGLDRTVTALPGISRTLIDRDLLGQWIDERSGVSTGRHRTSRPRRG